MLVEENEDVTFECQARGDPPPTIIWRREDGQIPHGRSSILGDRSLRIERVKVRQQSLSWVRIRLRWSRSFSYIVPQVTALCASSASRYGRKQSLTWVWTRLKESVKVGLLGHL